MVIKTAKISCSGSGANEIVAAVSGKAIRVLGYVLSAVTAVNAKWQSASTDKSGLIYLPATTTVVAHVISRGDKGFTWFDTAVGEALNLNLSSGVAVGGHITYAEI